MMGQFHPTRAKWYCSSHNYLRSVGIKPMRGLSQQSYRALTSMPENN